MNFKKLFNETLLETMNKVKWDDLERDDKFKELKKNSNLDKIKKNLISIRKEFELRLKLPILFAYENEWSTSKKYERFNIKIQLLYEDINKNFDKIQNDINDLSTILQTKIARDKF